MRNNKERQKTTTTDVNTGYLTALSPKGSHMTHIENNARFFGVHFTGRVAPETMRMHGFLRNLAICCAKVVAWVMGSIDEEQSDLLRLEVRNLHRA